MTRERTSSALASEIWERLRSGTPLDDLPLERVDGRVDLRGFTAPEDRRPTVATHEVGGLEFNELEGEPPRSLDGVELVSLDLSGSDLEGILLADCRVRNCRFDGASLAGAGMWLTAVEDSTFVGANLDHAQIGAWGDGVLETPAGDRGDSFHGCDFSRATMRKLVCDAGEFVDCIFDETRIEDVDFGSTSFVRC